MDNAEMAQKVIKAGVMPAGGSRSPRIRSLIQAMQRRIERSYGTGASQDEPTAEGLSYSAVLLWSGQLVQANPSLLPRFASYVHAQTGGRGVPDGYEEYGAVAVEWFMLGLQRLLSR